MPLPFVLSMGEPAGISGEIIWKAWQALRKSAQVFYIVADYQWIKWEAINLGLSLRPKVISSPKEASEIFGDFLPVFPIKTSVVTSHGKCIPHNAQATLESLELSVTHVQEGQAQALITCPIQKSALYEAHFPYPGHTEYLAHKAGMKTPSVMMLAVPSLRVVPITIHIPLGKVANNLSRDAIIQKSLITAQGLKKYFNISQPRLAIAGLNPHAGENGTIGQEEDRIIQPAIDILKQKGLDVSGPMVADTLFHEEARKQYDAVICMYHDQALIPLKTIDFYNGVNITLGLPFIRTSPDHGTALDIAGQNKARAQSLIAAIKTANQMSKNMQKHV